MIDFFYEYVVRTHFRELAVWERQAEHCGWYRRRDNRPPKNGWRFRTGKVLIRVGCWLQGNGDAQAVRSSGKA
jgi:hypothetical protein